MSKRSKNPHAVALGRLGGIAAAGAGARAINAKLTPEERREKAQHAARARWKKKR